MTVGFDAPARSVRPTGAVPGPRGVPLLGVLPQLWRDPLQYLLSVAREYGDVVCLPVGTGRFYLATHPNEVKQVLQDRHQHYVKAPHYKRTAAMFGDGLITSEGALWRRQRHLTQPAFQRRRQAFFGTAMTAATAEMLDRWSAAAASGGALDLTREMIDLAKEILFKAMFGGAIADPERRLSRALHLIQQSVNPVAIADPFQIVRRLPTPTNWRVRAAVQMLDDFVYDMIERRRRHPTGEDDFLSLLLTARDEETGEGMADRQVRDEVVTILQAGHEPTANTLTWTFYALSQSPHVEERLREEIVTVVGDRPPSADDVPRLPFTMTVLHEVLRLYPPGWVIARSPVNDEEVGGYRIPANAIVVLSPYVTHRLPAFWSAPDVFDPERFLPNRSADRPRFAYFPFGGGPRLCAGEYFAMTELPLVVAMVIRAFRLTLVPGQRIVPRTLITLLPPATLAMTPHRM